MQFKAVVFDLDGTLLDTLEDIGDSVNKALLQHGFPIHDLEKYREFIGDGPKELINRALPPAHRNPDIIESCLNDYLKNYQQSGEPNTRIYAGVPDLLDELIKKNIRVTILSNKRHDLAKNCVIRFFANRHFDLVLGLRESIPRKPHPAGAFEISDHLDIPTRKIVYVGDSTTDMDTAIAANMFPVGVSWGFHSIKALRSHGAKFILDHPMQLLDLFYQP